MRLAEAKVTATELDAALQRLRTLAEGSDEANAALRTAIQQHTTSLDNLQTAATMSLPSVSFTRRDETQARVSATLEALRNAPRAGPGDVGSQLVPLLVDAALAAEEAARRLHDGGQYWRHLLLDRLGENEALAHQLRIDAQAMASGPTRADLRRLSDLGAANTTAAIRHAYWSMQLHLERRHYEALHLVERLKDPLYVGKATWAGAMGLGFLFAWFWISRRAPRLWAVARRGAMGWTSTAGNARTVDAGLTFVETVAPPLLLLFAIRWLAEILSAIAPEPELSLLAQLAEWTLSYRLVSGLLHLFILRVTRRRMVLSDSLQTRIDGSLRIILRYSFLAAMAVEVMRGVFGNGAVFQTSRAIAVFGLAPICVALLRRWQEDIIGAYLRYRPEASLTRLVEQARGSWYGTFVALAAFAVVAGHGAAVLGRDFVLGFEQSRRALAFLFRLRIERQAQKRG
ncbi:MAG: hypothetical protein ACO3JL_20630, partial [Myxococcota bacterium]